MIANSLLFKIQSKQCDFAAKLSLFLEVNIAAHLYDFALPDLLYFRCKKTRFELRENAVWQALEAEFVTVGGRISGDWEEEENQPENEDAAASYYGYVDARCYEQCSPIPYNLSAIGKAAYYSGYGQGMDVNLECDGGIAPDEDRG